MCGLFCLVGGATLPLLDTLPPAGPHQPRPTHGEIHAINYFLSEPLEWPSFCTTGRTGKWPHETTPHRYIYVDIYRTEELTPVKLKKRNWYNWRWRISTITYLHSRQARFWDNRLGLRIRTRIETGWSESGMQALGHKKSCRVWAFNTRWEVGLKSIGAEHLYFHLNRPFGR